MISDTSSFPDILVPCGSALAGFSPEGDRSPLLQKFEWCHVNKVLLCYIPLPILTIHPVRYFLSILLDTDVVHPVRYEIISRGKYLTGFIF